MNQTVQALCAKCRVPVERVAEPNPEDRYACPICGNGDTHEAIMSEIGEYIQEVAAQQLSDMLAGAIRGSSVMSGRSTHTPSGRAWRFIANVEL